MTAVTGTDSDKPGRINSGLAAEINLGRHFTGWNQQRPGPEQSYLAGDPRGDDALSHKPVHRAQDSDIEELALKVNLV